MEPKNIQSELEKKLIQPAKEIISPKKTNWLLIGLAATIAILALLSVWLTYQLSQRAQPIEPPAQPYPMEITPAPKDATTANWQTYTNTEYGFAFEYPARLQLEENKYAGEKGYAYSIDFNGFGLGGISIDYEAPREGSFLDTRGYRKERGKVIYKFAIGKEYEIPQELIRKDFVNPNGVEVIVVEGKTSKESNWPVEGTPGEGNLGALINLKHSQLTGLALFWPMDSTMVSEQEFYQILDSFDYI